MAVDAALWLIFASGIALIWGGCILTARRHRELHRLTDRRAEPDFGREFHRAA